MGEVIGHDEAFEEGAREHQARVDERIAHLERVKMVGGPNDGGHIMVPRNVMRHDGAIIPVALGSLSKTLVIPGERRRHADYAVDSDAGVLRYVHTTHYPGAA